MNEVVKCCNRLFIIKKSEACRDPSVVICIKGYESFYTAECDDVDLCSGTLVTGSKAVCVSALVLVLAR